MNYANIKYMDVANGPGCRTTLFVSGCTHHCQACFNYKAWDFSFGNEFNTEVEQHILESLENPYTAGLSVLGGEPMEPVNQAALLPFIKRVRSCFPNKSIWVWSGYTWEELTDRDNHRCHCIETAPLLELIDVLVDGEFVRKMKNLALRFRGSANQRVLDVRESLIQGKPILSHYMERD